MANEERGRGPRDMEIDLLDMVRILWRRAWIIVLAAILGAGGGFLLTRLTPPTYETKAELMIIQNSGSFTGQIAFLGNGNTDRMANRLQLLRSPVVLEPAQQLLWNWGEDLAAVDLGRHITTSTVRDTDVITLTAQGGTAQEAYIRAAAVVEAYQDYSEQRAQEQSLRIKEFLEEQVASTLERVEAAEMAVRDFQQDVGIIYLTSEEQKVNSHIASLEGQLMTAEIRLEEKRLRLNTVEQDLAAARQALPRSSTLAPEQLMEELQKLLASLEATRVEYITRGLANTPEIRSIEQRIDSMTVQIQEQLAEIAGQAGDPRGAFAAYQELVLDQVRLLAEISGLQNQIMLFGERIAEYQEDLWLLSEKAFTYARLERDVLVSNTTFQMLNEELERARIAVQREMDDVQLIRPPSLPAGPVSPRPLLNLAIGTVLGMMLSVGGIFVLEFMDNTIKSRRQVEDLGLVLLGMIPKIPQAKKNGLYPLLHSADATDPVAASYVRLESNLRLTHFEDQPKVIVTTSAVPGEGKSTTALNFAYTVAQSQQSVLLIDGDLRRPIIHKALDEARTPGLMEVVTGQVEFDDAVRSIERDDIAVDVLPAGKRPPSIVHAFRSQAFKDLLRQARDQYDWVIIDLPPVVVGSEALEVAMASDGALLVIEANRTALPVMEEAMSQLEQADVKVLGAVLNQYNPKASGYGYGAYYENYYYETSDD